MRTRTPWTYQGKPYPVTCGEYIGFLYRITCTHPEAQKQYLGRKFFYFKFNTKTLKKESDWKTYKGSSKNVHAAIEQYGEEHFQFEILQLFKTKGGLSYAEIEALVTAEVLHATGPTGERLYWNDAIGNIKFIAKERFSPEHKARLAASVQKTWTEDRKQAQAERIAAASKGNKHHLKVTPDVAKKILALVKKKVMRKDIAAELGLNICTIREVVSNPSKYL